MFLISKKRLLVAGQIAVTAVLLWILGRRFDWNRFGELVRSLPPSFYIGSLVIVAVGQLAYAMRWRAILSELGVVVSPGAAIQQQFIGLFFSNVMPTGVGGDAAKVYLLGREAGYAAVTASVVADRFLGFFWLAIAGAVLAWLSPLPEQASIYALDRTLLTLFAVGFLVLLSVVKLIPQERRLASPEQSRWRSLIERVNAAAGLARRAIAPRAVAVSGVITIGYAVMLALIYQQYLALIGLSASLASLLLVIVSVAIFVNVPLSINGIGLREQLHVLLLTTLGVPAEASVWISLLLFAHILLCSLAGLGFWLRVPLQVREVRS